jgi:hypothetical protein
MIFKEINMEALRKAINRAAMIRGQNARKIKVTRKFCRKLLANRADPDIVYASRSLGLSFVYDLVYCGIPVEIDDRMNSNDFELVF